MPVIQIAKIRIRRGVQADVPALDPGEFCQALDTGRLFLGRTPDINLPGSGNVEVLTDAATEALDRVVETRLRDVRRGVFSSVPIASSTDADFVNVLVAPDDPNQMPDPLRLDGAVALLVSARITYTIFTSSTPIRSGVLTVLADNLVPEPVLTDEYTSRVVAPDSTAGFNNIRFRAAIVAGRVVLQCRNRDTRLIRIRFRMERPEPI